MMAAALLLAILEARSSEQAELLPRWPLRKDIAEPSRSRGPATRLWAT